MPNMGTLPKKGIRTLAGCLFFTSPLLPALGNSKAELLEIWGQFGNFMIMLRNKITKPEKTAEQVV